MKPDQVNHDTLIKITIDLQILGVLNIYSPAGFYCFADIPQLLACLVLTEELGIQQLLASSLNHSIETQCL